MTDVSPEITAWIENRIEYYLNRNREANRIKVNAQAGKATFLDANAYAGCIGADLAAAIRSLPTEMLPNGMMYYNISDKVLRPILGDAASEILDVTDQVFIAVDSAAGIGLIPVRPDQANKIDGIVELASSKPWDEVKHEVGAVVETFARKVVDESIQVNSEFHYNAGLNPKIIRTIDRGACEWCREVAGTYEYAKVRNTGNDVFRRHDNCGCTVVYEPGKGKQRNVVWKPSADQKWTYKQTEKALQKQLTGESQEDFVKKVADILEAIGM